MRNQAIAKSTTVYTQNVVDQFPIGTPDRGGYRKPRKNRILQMTGTL